MTECVFINSISNLITVLFYIILQEFIYVWNGHDISESFSSLQQKNESVTYDSLFGRRRIQAQHSVLIEVQSEKSCTDVHSHCSQYGKINSMFHYIIEKNQRVNSNYLS